MMGFLRSAGSWPRFVFAFGLMTGVLWAVAGCDDGVVDPELLSANTWSEYVALIPDSTQVDSLVVPEAMVLGSEDFRTLTIGFNLSPELTDAIRAGRVAEPRRIFGLIRRAGVGATAAFYLYDDGGAFEHSDLPVHQPQYLASKSGDLIPGDFIFSNRINSLFSDVWGTPYEDEYLFEFYFNFDSPVAGGQGDGHPETFVISRNVLVSANEGPVVDSVDIPDSLYSGFDAQTWSIDVSDPNEASGDEVTDVTVTLVADDITWREILFAPTNLPEWTFSVDSSFAAGLPTNDYEMQILAIDKFEYPSDMTVVPIWIENEAPELLSLVAPDTVRQPGPDDPDNIYVFELNVQDSQGQGDLEIVYYTVVDPTGNFFESPDYVFRDDGEDPDPVAEDRLWNSGFRVPNTVSNFGTYTFTFYAEDRAGNVSVPIEKFIELVAYSEPQ